MANNLIQIRRTSISGRAANTLNLPNAGELALNMTDGIMYSGNGSSIFEIGANTTNSRVSNLLTTNTISAATLISVGNNTVNTEITAGVIRLNGSELFIGNNTVITGNSVAVGNVEITEQAVFINGLFALTSQSSGIADNANALGGVSANQYITVSNNYTITGNHTYLGNVSISKLLAGGSLGNSGEVLVANSTGGIFWSSVIGYTGSKGDTGSIGGLGYTGSQGTGYVGSRGNTGFDGSKGELGFSGSAGFVGSTGTGYTGSKGDNTTANAISQSFTANGSQVQFTLNTSVNSQNNIIVAVDGLVQAPVTHYTIAGTTLTFTSAPVANSIVEARNFELGTGVVGFTGSGGTGFTGSTGAGFTGSVGNLGYTGSEGSLGFTGSTGIGFTGSIGGLGYTGSKGSDGVLGGDGYAGSAGFAGSVGFTGSVGIGFAGSVGFAGSIGIGYSGSTGFTGSVGIGFAGSVGFTGSIGPQGAAGTFGGAAFQYVFDVSTVDPTVAANGSIRLSNTTLTSANTLYISYVDDLNANVQPFLQTVDDSTSAIKGHFSITDLANNNNYILYAIIGNHIEDSNHFNIPISYLSGSASFANNTEIVITFARTGDVGDTGPTGYVGSKGNLGYTGSIGFVGSAGIDGYTGSTGYVGSKGDLGYAGSIGFTGSIGGLGFTGSKGNDGVLGGDGYTGSIGFAGSTGAGYTGSKGDNTTANAISQSFTANGTQLSFTLNTSVNSQNNIIVSVDGLVQTPVTHYTISGTTLTFTSSPVSNSIVEARNFELGTGVVGYTGSGGLGFTGSAGAGFTGSIGSLGFTGSKGTDGVLGGDGYTGSVGFTGSIGIGYAGSIGFTGSIGSIGFTGSTGIGYDGSIGFTGSGGVSGGIQYNVTNSGSGAYVIEGSNNPTLTLVKGFTYYFILNASGHPFFIKTVSGTGTGNQYNDGVTNNGADVGTITFTVPFSAPSTLYYNCQYHGVMAGTFNIVDSVQGPIGFVGSAGYAGSQGNAGFVGSIGDAGSIGFTGSTGAGFTGSIGGLGFTGSKGADGVLGGDGYTGSIGFTGSAGAGFTGSIGSSGFTGSGGLGFTGSGGAGFTGSKGDSSSANAISQSFTANGTQLTFTLGTSVNSQNNIIVSVDGLVQTPITHYTITGTTLTFTSTPVSNSIIEARNFEIGTGVIGYTGSGGNGFTGSSGSIGFTGSRGTDGTLGGDGYTGSIGYSGSVGAGYTGSIGSLGYTGSRGTDGTLGGDGYTGSIGFVGSTGAGYTGSKGDSTTANAISQSFTANGTQLTFTLDTSVNSQNNIIVSVDGLVQTPVTHYTISGTTLTFTSIPISNSIVEARNFEIGTGVVGYTGSGGTGFTGSSGSGFTGSIGELGFTGSRGTDGTLGGDGYTGSIGFTGSGGAGYNGSIGFTGSKGDNTTANAISQSFTANGTQLTFTLDTSVNSQNNIIVSVDGLVQTPVTHYTISGTTLTFTSSPISNSIVEARNFELGTGVVGYTGSGGTGFTGSAGAGYTGSIGGLGYSGSKGDLGYSGSTGVGYTGSIGGLGYSGSKGDLGYSGSTGVGYTGSIGGSPPRVNTATSTATLTWNSDTYDQYQLTAMAAGVTVSADSGTPSNGQKILFRFKDNGTARSISLTTGTSKSFRAIGTTLPTTTVISKTLYVGAIYNSADDRWDVVATAQEA